MVGTSSRWNVPPSLPRSFLVFTHSIFFQQPKELSGISLMLLLGFDYQQGRKNATVHYVQVRISLEHFEEMRRFPGLDSITWVLKKFLKRSVYFPPLC